MIIPCLVFQHILLLSIIISKRKCVYIYVHMSFTSNSEYWFKTQHDVKMFVVKQKKKKVIQKQKRCVTARWCFSYLPLIFFFNFLLPTISDALIGLYYCVRLSVWGQKVVINSNTKRSSTFFVHKLIPTKLSKKIESYFCCFSCNFITVDTIEMIS